MKPLADAGYHVFALMLEVMAELQAGTVIMMGI